jgi:hypothetical protein
MAEAIYLLCALTSVLCAVLLGRGFLRGRVRLLLWSSLCFAGLAINNVILFVDLVIVPGPEIDLRLWRSWVAFFALLPLVYGLVWES